ncbi:hypothetical protein SELMODRAFT_422334 [Selaginella moellendorffii]|uniref:Uncharacterized protein n=1 Tax=Selaginella moellendorffii TaxID=88036 RepID=D8SI30_SELML|nr:hypothetical protein SELMODRAFT_422334 [Selaginella moellendorffii]
MFATWLHGTACANPGSSGFRKNTNRRYSEGSALQNMVYDWFGGIPRSGTGKVKQLTEENIGQDVAIALGNTKLKHIDVDAILPKHSSFRDVLGSQSSTSHSAWRMWRSCMFTINKGGDADQYLWRPLRKNNADFDFVLPPQTLGKITHDPPSLEYLAKALRAWRKEFGKKDLEDVLIPSENFSQLGFQHYRTSRKQQSNENVDLFQDIC